VIDSPPVLAVTDSSILSRLVSTTMFVVRSAKTTEDALLGAIEQLQALDAKIAGVVVNHVEKQSGYYYYNRNYYTQENEKESVVRGKKLVRWLGVGLSNLLGFLNIF
jgi:Mrp family chromosome partitioning ATPase